MPHTFRSLRDAAAQEATSTSAPNPRPILNNGAVLTISGIIKDVMSSAAEAEVAGLFINAKEGEIL
jgi:hypothetical protein